VVVATLATLYQPMFTIETNGYLDHDKKVSHELKEEAKLDRQEYEHQTSQASPNTALRAGLGVASHDVNKHDEPSGAIKGTPLDQKPFGKDIGDHLHGIRNRGVIGESGFPGTEGFGSGATTHAIQEEQAEDRATLQNPIPSHQNPLGKNTSK